MLATRPPLRSLTLDELGALYCEADDTVMAACVAEAARRDRVDAARKAWHASPAGRARAEWEAAAYANYLAAEERCRGYLLSPAGERTGRGPWPMLWEGSPDSVRHLASDELITFWDYETPRPAGPGAFIAAERDARDLDAMDAHEVTRAAADTPAGPVTVASRDDAACPWEARCERHGLIATATTQAQAHLFAASHLAALHTGSTPAAEVASWAPVTVPAAPLPSQGGLDVLEAIFASPRPPRARAGRIRQAARWIRRHTR